MIAQQGLRVGLFERERFPRFHIGESLIPETYWVLKRLNMLPKMQRSHFVKKYSVQFVNASGKLSAPFYFWDNKPHECSQTWQVVRSEFDQMMLENAREHGVDAHEGVHVLDVLFEGDRAVGVRIQDADGARRDVRAKVVVDASGPGGAAAEPVQAARVGSDPEQGRDLDLLGRCLSRHRPRRRRDDGAADRRARDGWFWYIPLHDNIVSVGVVAPFDYLFKGRRKPRADLPGGSRRLPCGEGARIDGARRSPDIFATRDYSYRANAGGRRRLGARRRRVRVSRSAVLVGRPARAALRGDGRRRDRRRPGEGDTSAAQLGRWGAPFNHGVDRMRRLVCEFYDGFSFGNFVRTIPSCATPSPIC